MYEILLEEAGLTRNESVVYLTLLRIGKSKSGKIVKEAKVSGGKIYETLYKLIDKGLVKLVTENGIKNFIANDPKTILDYLKEREKSFFEKEKELEKILPNLSNLAKVDEKLETVSLVKGFRGIHTLVYSALDIAKTIKVMGVRSSKDSKFNNFWKNWHKRRSQLKKKAFVLFSDKNTEYWKYIKKLKHTEVRENLSFTPSAIMVIDNNSYIFSYDGEFTCIHILSVQIANSFSSFFDDLWRL